MKVDKIKVKDDVDGSLTDWVIKVLKKALIFSPTERATFEELNSIDFPLKIEGEIKEISKTPIEIKSSPKEEVKETFSESISSSKDPTPKNSFSDIEKLDIKSEEQNKEITPKNIINSTLAKETTPKNIYTPIKEATPKNYSTQIKEETPKSYSTQIKESTPKSYSNQIKEPDRKSVV